MTKNSIIFIPLLLFFSMLQAQDIHKFREENPFYWKNKLPHPGYWQQDVHYQIKANIDEQTDIVSGTEKLIYYNNSPDNLDRVYFHLYTNAQTKGSYLEKVYNAHNVYPEFGKYASQGLGCQVESITYNGSKVRTELDNTILIVYLDEPIKSGTSATFDITFKTYFDQTGIRNRMKHFDVFGNKHYDGVHWYPRISVYDRKFGWTADQHFDREFYGDYGVYDVELTFANDYIVEATGDLLNRNEVLPDTLRRKLSISNFKDKPFGSAPSVIIKRDGTRKTWKYHAENVHDFAFTADPTYRIGEVRWNGVKCIALAQESNASKWQNAAEFTAKVIEFYSTSIGMYAWPKVIVADARDGMEYPMITLDGGHDPGYRGLIAHEVAHMWFYGMVGNNETYRAALDEGFTQFISVEAMNAIDGEYEVMEPSKSAYVNKFREIRPNIESDLQLGYLRDALAQTELPLNTHSDHFNLGIRQAGGYRQVYSKTGVMLYNLEYVLGEELFWKALRNYFKEWQFCHPYFEDFRNSIIHYTKADLNWFFDQWLETTKTIDYSVNRVTRLDKEDNYEIVLERKGSMQMPIDLQVIDKEGRTYNYYIPNTYFLKHTKAGILPRWTGWAVLNPFYEVQVQIPGGISDVIIDPSYRLGDINLQDNSLRRPVDVKFDSKIGNPSDRRNYELRIRPDIWYNALDGVKAGIHLNGDYMNFFDRFSLSAWANTRLLSQADEAVKNELAPLSFNAWFADKFPKLGNLEFQAHIADLDGLQTLKFTFLKQDKLNNTYYIAFKSMSRRDSTDLLYSLYPGEWAASRYNNTLQAGFEHPYQYRSGQGKIMLSLRSSTIGADYDYAQLKMTVINSIRAGKLDIRTRTFAQLGSGSNVPGESALYLAGANPEELTDNKFTRAPFYDDPGLYDFGTGTGHFHMGGGLNLRGYAGYLATFKTSDDEVRVLYKGNSGAAFNAEIDVDRLVRFRPSFTRNWLHLDTYLFGDAGVINYSQPTEDLAFADWRADAGFGTALTIKKFGPLHVNPFTIRFDMPLILSHTPNIDPEFINFRYVIGINRSF